VCLKLVVFLVLLYHVVCPNPRAAVWDRSTDFLPAGASVIETHFGRIEDLRTDNTTNKNTDQLGYTDAPVNLHTDQPFIADPPGTVPFPARLGSVLVSASIYMCVYERESVCA
jgi:hypothetical protein